MNERPVRSLPYLINHCTSDDVEAAAAAAAAPSAAATTVMPALGCGVTGTVTEPAEADGRWRRMIVPPVATEVLLTCLTMHPRVYSLPFCLIEHEL